jgi:hypothetical protein
LLYDSSSANHLARPLNWINASNFVWRSWAIVRPRWTLNTQLGFAVAVAGTSLQLQFQGRMRHRGLPDGREVETCCRPALNRIFLSDPQKPRGGSCLAQPGCWRIYRRLMHLAICPNPGTDPPSPVSFCAAQQRQLWISTLTNCSLFLFLLVLRPRKYAECHAEQTEIEHFPSLFNT